MHTITTLAGPATITTGPGFVRLNGAAVSITEARELADALHFAAGQAAKKQQASITGQRLAADAKRAMVEA